MDGPAWGRYTSSEGGYMESHRYRIRAVRKDDLELVRSTDNERIAKNMGRDLKKLGTYVEVYFYDSATGEEVKL